MQLTQGAIGNLINRYRAVLRKCGLLNAFGSLAVAGMLVMGGAGMAAAAPAAAPWTEKEVTIDGSNSQTVTSLYDFEYDVDQGNARNIATEKLYIKDGGSLTITGGGRLAHYLYQGESTKTGLDVIMDGGTLTVGDGSTYTSIDANTIAISGGTVELKGGPSNNWANGAYIGGYRGVDITGGTITMSGNNSEIFAGNHLYITGGEIIMAGDSAATAAHIMMTSDNKIGGDAKVSVSSGKFGVFTTARGLTIADKAAIDVQGSLLLQPDVDRNTPATVVYGGNGYESSSSVSQTGGTVNVASGGKLTIGTGVAYTMSGGTLTNAGTLTVNGQLDISSMGNAVTNTGTIDVVNASGNGYTHGVRLTLTETQLKSMIAAGQVNVSGEDLNGYGKIDLGESATLDTSMIAASAANGKVSVGAQGSLQVQDLTLKGDSLAIDDEGRIKANSVTLEPATQNGDFTLTDGQLMLKGEDGSNLSVVGTGGLILNGTTKAELKLGEFNSDSGVVNPGGAINTSVTAQNGTVTVNAGTWTLADGKTLDIQSGSALNIGGGTDPGYSGMMPATLVVSGTLQSADAGDGSKGINVLQGGNLEAAGSKLFTMSGDTATIASGLNTFNVANGGLVTITGQIDGKNTISLDAAKSIASAIKTGDGLVQYKDGVTVTAGATETDADLAATSTIVNTTATVTATGGTATLTGGYGANNVAVTNDQAGDVNVAVNGNLTLVGEGQLMTATDNTGASVKIDKVTVDAGQELNLGYTGYEGNDATLSSNVALAGAGSAVNAYGNKTVGDITAVQAGEGIVSATGGILNTGNIGTATNAVDVVKADMGSTVESSGDVYTETVDLVGGGLTADNITVTTAIDGVANVMTNGNMIAETGDIDLSAAGASAVSGLIQATQGNINALGQNITRDTSGNRLTLAAAKKIDARDITANDVVAETLAATGNVALDNGELNLSGTNANASTVAGTLTLDKMASDVSDLTVTSSATATGGTLLADSLTFNAGATLSDGIVADVDTLVIAGGNLEVGQSTDTQGSIVNVKDLTLGGNSLLIDPAYGGDATRVSVETFTGGTTSDGDIGVGQNGTFTFGLADGGVWLNDQLAAIGITALDPNTVGAVMGVFDPLTIGTGFNLRLDGNQTNAQLDASMLGQTDTAHFAANSLTVINGANPALQTNVAGGAAAITFGSGSGNLNVENGAKLYIADAVAGAQYQVVAGSNNMATAFNNGANAYGDAASTGWKGANLYSTSNMVGLTGVADAANNTITFTATRNDAKTVFPGLSGGMAAAVNKLYTGINGGAARGWYDLADVNSADMGVRFLSRATDNRFIGNDAEAAVRTIESAARMAVAGAVPQMTKMASDAATNAVVNRLGLANPANGMQTVNAEGKITDRNTTGFALWIAPTWQNRTGFNMDADNLDGGYNGNIGGVALGADYTFENAIRAGITFNIGGGYAESAGDFSNTTNSMNYWGLGAYVGWSANNFALLGDVSYTSTYNKLKQDLDAGMRMSDLKADVQASAWQAGIRGEYKLETSALDIIPHVGVRYMSLNTWGYDVKSNGTVLEGDGMNQNIWTFPVGVTFSKDIDINNGWYFRPSVDFTVIPAVGDIKAKEDVTFTGLPGTYEVETQTMDYLTWQGGLGLEFGSDNMAVGVNYTLQAGQTGTGHGIFGTFRYEF